MVKSAIQVIWDECMVEPQRTMVGDYGVPSNRQKVSTRLALTKVATMEDLIIEQFITSNLLCLPDYLYLSGRRFPYD